MQTIYTSLHTDNHNNTPSLNFYRPNQQCQSILQLTLVKIMPEDTHADAQTDKLIAIYRSHPAPGAKYTIGMN